MVYERRKPTKARIERKKRKKKANKIKVKQEKEERKEMIKNMPDDIKRLKEIDEDVMMFCLMKADPFMYIHFAW